MKAFVVVTESAWMAERFTAGLNGRQMFLSYAHEFPDLSAYDTSSMWLAGGYAARLHRIGLAGSLMAPGQDWLSTVDSSLVGREIVTQPLSAMPYGIQLFAKPAEAKIDAIKAGLYKREYIDTVYQEQDIPVDTLLQWTTTLMDMNHEHRFFIANREVMTGSPYLIDGQVYDGYMTSPRYEEAVKFAEFAVKELGENQPPAYTLDVAFDEKSGKWIIVEANPAWSSGIYGADPSSMIDVLDIACNNTDLRWTWKPAEYLMNMAAEAPIMEVVDAETATGVFIYQG